MSIARRLRSFVLVFLCGAVAGAAALRWADGVRGEKSTPLALERAVPEVQIVNEPLPEAARKLSEAAGVPVVVDAVSLSAIGIDVTRRVSLRAQHVPLCMLLDELTAQYFTMKNRAAWTAETGQVVITTDNRSRRHASVLRAYDVGDLLASAGPPPAPPVASSSPRLIRMGSGSLFRTTPSGGVSLPAPPMTDAQQRLCDLMIWFVLSRPDEFHDLSDGAVRFYGDRMLVFRPPQAQVAVAQFLAQLRSMLPANAGPVPTAGVAKWSETLNRWIVADASAAESKLDLPLPAMRIENVPLIEALRRVGQVAGVEVQIAPPADDGPPPDQNPVTVEWPTRRLSDALSEVLRAAGRDGRLHWSIDGNVVRVRAEGRRQSPLATRVYDMREWFTLKGGAQRLPGVLNPAGDPDSETPTPDELYDHAAGWLGGFLPNLESGFVRTAGGFVIVRATWEDQAKAREALANVRRSYMAATRPARDANSTGGGR